ncbi:Uncharacterised protein [BD1-7 clade bacterium]|uniref:DUF4136 domain-containing protein n=1 Tax=BD1-7 clade bacterium TaxID=2029982 RepID=A0A5S9P511_9GAMM|nr:Uncharacterised protein [BD1-7 clade bacterium]CAA0098540.1 Uncharacterised protein [BD1-7 clade bacterium]
MTHLKLILVLTASLLLAACGTTNMRDVWQAPNFHKTDLNDVLIVGMTANATNRMVFEREFVAALMRQGLKATPSYTVLGRKTPDEEAIISYLKDHPTKYVLITYVSNQEVDKTYIKPTVSTVVTGYGYPYGSYGGYYYPTLGSVWGPGSVNTITTPGYFDETTKTILVTSIYNAETGDIEWTGRSSTFEANSISRVTSDVSKVVLKHIN